MSHSTNIFTKENLLCRDRVGAMIFLLFCLCYGYQTTQIPLFPGDEYEPFTARTLPTILTYVGIGLALMLLVTGQPDKQSGAVMSFNWKLLIAFLVLMALYGLGLTYIGFVLGAMSTDYYPRLTAVIHDHDVANRLVNEQTEVDPIT